MPYPPTFHEERLPVEVCEVVIDNIRPRQLFDRQEWTLSSTALCACSLVCRAWRPRAQRSLFDVVTLRSARCLYRLAALLTNSPHIPTYIYEIRLYGRCIQSSNSVLALFPTVIGTRVPNLLSLALYTTESNVPSQGVTRGTAGIPAHEEIPLPYLPIHPRFSTLLNPLSKLTSLRIGIVKFRSFGDFARMLHKLHSLTDLMCDHVEWAILGLIPPCMVDPPQSSPFLPRLENLRSRYPG
ncbi:hypothetical protein C8Q80DRAFT_433318 [Daedaleopsis nitida]|nr:hypothetical protein C8Q80DRAFT_433318 [Daedaleopsis nitida]